MIYSALAFQFTLPRGERRQIGRSQTSSRGFNSRSREGSDRNEQRVCTQHSCFNSRSREGSDSHLGIECLRLRFQFTLPRGERRRRIGELLPCGDVSIHAPARGATALSLQDGAKERFNSRSREGSDTLLCKGGESIAGFQFTLPRGERP